MTQLLTMTTTQKFPPQAELKLSGLKSGGLILEKTMIRYIGRKKREGGISYIMIRYRVSWAEKGGDKERKGYKILFTAPLPGASIFYISPPLLAKKKGDKAPPGALTLARKHRYLHF